MLTKYSSLIFIIFVSTQSFFAQINDNINLEFNDSKSRVDKDSKSMLTMNRNAKNPYLTFKEAIYNQSINGDLILFDLDKNRISGAKRRELLTVTDTAVVFNSDTYEEIVTITKSTIIGNDLNGCDLGITLELKEDKVKSKINYLSPYVFIFNGNQKTKQNLYSISTQNGCENPEYGYLISTNLDKERHPEITNFLFDILDGKKESNVYDAKLNRLSLERLQENMFHIDTTIVINYDTYEEQVLIVQAEVDRDELELNILGEFTYCSENGTFDYKVKAAGFTENVVDSETGIVKFRRNLFLVKMD